MTKTPNYVFDDELYHHGITGQRWGYRRFQNEDGSWTPEGRERYGEGGAKAKSDLQKYKARVSYNTQKYKADLKSKSAKEQASRSAKEERHSIRENAKTMRIARKEQAKFDKLNKKEEMKLERQGKPFGMKMTRTRNMSDDDLQKAIDRLKLQAEYNKAYTLATSPNSALVKADRFFEGPTGKFVADIAARTIPELAKTAFNKALEKKETKDDKLDKLKKEADINFTNAQARNFNAQAAEREMKANDTYQKMHAEEVEKRKKELFGKNKK